MIPIINSIIEKLININFIIKLFSIFIALLGLTFVVVIHELGHFLFCKIFKVYVPTFSIGMGKRLFGFKSGATDFRISILPIGGFIEISENETIKNYNDFYSLSYYKKVLITLGGIAFNIILAFLIFFLLFFLNKLPDTSIIPYQFNTNKIEKIKENSINKNILLPNDKIIKINQKELNSNIAIFEKEITTAIENKQFELPIEIERNNKIIATNLKINNSKNMLNLTDKCDLFFYKKPKLSFIDSIKQAYEITIYYIEKIIISLKNIFAKKDVKSLGGPVMIIATCTKILEKSTAFFILFLALISINLGVMNFIPLPIFDGGQFLLYTIETITRKQASEKIKNIIGIASWTLAIGLLIIFSIKDIISLFF